jgi:tetraacyldisaccharide 4'-kinase
MDAGTGEGVDLKRLIGRSVRAFAGIARPEAFFRTLEDLGAHVVEQRRFPDHHEYQIGELEGLFSGAGPTWITTEKDWVKIKKHVPPGTDLWVLGVELEIVQGREDLEAALNALAPSS